MPRVYRGRGGEGYTMSKILDEILAANVRYEVSFGDNGGVLFQRGSVCDWLLARLTTCGPCWH